MKKTIQFILPILELIYLPILVLSGLALWLYRRAGSKHLRLSTRVLKNIGIFPIRDHYYEPLFNDKHLAYDLRKPRELPGVNFNELGQLELLKKLNYQTEFFSFVEADKNKNDPIAFKIDNGSFKSGDAEFLFNFVRHIKPKKIIEIGCGTSTKIIQGALMLNEQEQGIGGYHLCVEPYEQPWLEKFPNIELIRDKVENLDLKLFRELQDGDFIFIDSSHMIRPQGDVLQEYLSIIPSLPKGVYVHVHDIFSPHDYLDEWVRDHILFWNEQYLLEALLTGNDNLEVVAALNLLKHKYYDELQKVCTFLTSEREPGSFYFRTR